MGRGQGSRPTLAAKQVPEAAAPKLEHIAPSHLSVKDGHVAGYALSYVPFRFDGITYLSTQNEAPIFPRSKSQGCSHGADLVNCPLADVIPADLDLKWREGEYTLTYGLRQAGVVMSAVYGRSGTLSNPLFKAGAFTIDSDRVLTYLTWSFAPRVDGWLPPHSQTMVTRGRCTNCVAPCFHQTLADLLSPGSSVLDEFADKYLRPGMFKIDTPVLVHPGVKDATLLLPLTPYPRLVLHHSGGGTGTDVASFDEKLRCIGNSCPEECVHTRLAKLLREASIPW